MKTIDSPLFGPLRVVEVSEEIQWPLKNKSGKTDESAKKARETK